MENLNSSLNTSLYIPSLPGGWLLTYTSDLWSSKLNSLETLYKIQISTKSSKPSTDWYALCLKVSSLVHPFIGTLGFLDLTFVESYSNGNLSLSDSSKPTITKEKKRSN